MHVDVYWYKIFQVEAIDFEVTDLDDIDPSDFLSDGEDEVDNHTDYGVLTELDIFGRAKPENKQKPTDIQKVQLALKLQKRARELDLKANMLLSSVVQTTPTVAQFAFLLGQVSHVQMDGGAVTNVTSITPNQHVDLNEYANDYALNTIPLKTKTNGAVRFICRICKFQRGSWSGCDSHIRKMHSLLKYGPCGKCRIFTTFNADSYRSHLNYCGTQNTVQ